MAKSSRPTYWETCEAMDFRQLRQFIDDSLKQMYEVEERDQPETEREFQELLEMLREKIVDEAMPYIPPIPIEPEDPEFKPSDKLQNLQGQMKELQKHARRIIVDSEETERRLHIEYSRINVLSAEIVQLLRQEKRAYKACRNKRFNSYEVAVEQRRRVIANLSERERKLLDLIFRRKKIVDRVGKSIESAFLRGSGMRAKRLPWKVLPSGKSSADSVQRYYEGLQRRNPDIKFDKERLLKALSLRPSSYYVGIGEFEKYIVLTFDHTPKALLECPEFGNAIYIIHSDWQRLSRMTKRDLMSYRQHQATKIVHKGDWFRRVKRELEIA